MWWWTWYLTSDRFRDLHTAKTDSVWLANHFSLHLINGKAPCLICWTFKGTFRTFYPLLWWNQRGFFPPMSTITRLGGSSLRSVFVTKSLRISTGLCKLFICLSGLPPRTLCIWFGSCSNTHHQFKKIWSHKTKRVLLHTSYRTQPCSEARSVNLAHPSISDFLLLSWPESPFIHSISPWLNVSWEKKWSSQVQAGLS